MIKKLPALLSACLAAISLLAQRGYAESWQAYTAGRYIRYEDCFYGFSIRLGKTDPQYLADHPEEISRDERFGLDPWDYQITLQRRPPIYRIRVFRAPAGELGREMEALLAEQKAAWQKHLTRARVYYGPEDPRACNTTSTIYDETGIPRTILNRPRCVTTENLVDQNTMDWDWYCSGEPLDNWPEAIKTAVRRLLMEGADQVMTRGVFTGETEIYAGDPRELLRSGLEGNKRKLAYCQRRWGELMELLKEEEDPARRRELELERTALKESCPHAKPNIESYEKRIVELEERLNRVGWFTEEERARYRGWLMWQETRCARMVLEGKTDEAKKDFECRSLQIRDYLQFGPKGASEEVLKERAARELAPAPPKLPWETADKPQETSGNPQAAGSAPDGAGGIVSDGSPIHPSAVPGTGSRLTRHGSPITNPRAQAAGVAGLIALLGALVLRRSRP